VTGSAATAVGCENSPLLPSDFSQLLPRWQRYLFQEELLNRRKEAASGGVRTRTEEDAVGLRLY
jgi:hypothetical protein